MPRSSNSLPLEGVVKALALALALTACGPSPVIVDGLEARAMYVGPLEDAVQAEDDYGTPVLALSVAPSCSRAEKALVRNAAALWHPHARILVSLNGTAGNVMCLGAYPAELPTAGSIVLFPTADLTSVAHEMGHALGLGHDLKHPSDALMGAYSESESVTRWDVAALGLLY